MRLHLFGASGSGCSSLGRAMAKKFQLSYYDTDDYYWEASEPPFTVRAQATSRNARLQQDLLRTTGWVLAGSISSWQLDLGDTLSLVIFVRVPSKERIARLYGREVQRYGARVLSSGDMYTSSQAFIDWSRCYETGERPGRTLAQHTAWLAQLTCPTMTFDNVGPVDNACAQLAAQIEAAALHR